MTSPPFHLKTLGGLALHSPDGQTQFLPANGKRLALLAVLAADTNVWRVARSPPGAFLAESNSDRGPKCSPPAAGCIRLGGSWARIIIDAGAGDLRLNDAIVDSDIRPFPREAALRRHGGRRE
jgi:hypothetical protein